MTSAAAAIGKRQCRLEAARLDAIAQANWLARFRCNYIPMDNRRQVVSALRELALVAMSASCDTEAAWLEGYHVGRDEEWKGIDAEEWAKIRRKGGE